MSRHKNNSRGGQGAVQEALESLRSAISSGQLRPNQQVVESEIARKLGMSRTPVRDAIRQLEILGYLTRLPNRRIVVSHITSRKLRDYYEIREALETMAIRLVCQRASKEQIDRIVRCNMRVNKVIEARDPSTSHDVNMDFHKQLIVASGNKELWSQIEKYYWFSSHITYTFTLRDWRALQREHTNIVDAVCQRNETKAVNAVRKHVRTAVGFAVRHI